MGLFSNILEKLGLKKPEVQTAPLNEEHVKPPMQKPAAKPTTPAKVYTDSRPLPPGMGGQRVSPDQAAPAKPAPMAMVDVMSKLEKMAKDKGEKLDWKKSIVDLLKTLDIESSLEARKELAVELGCPPEKMKDSVNMNIWLHKTVLEKIAENGGNLPKEMLD